MIQSEHSIIERLPEESDFRIFLQNNLIRRHKTNSKYSLRSFARLLDVEPSFLSKILNQKRSITEAILFKFGKRLGLGPQEIEKFKKTSQKTRYRKNKKSNDTSMNFHPLTLDQFQMISDWYHYVILELVTVRDFQPSTRWIAKVLGISVTETRAAVERLIRLGYLENMDDAKWINKSGNNTTLGNDFTRVAFRKLQKQILTMAIEAMDEIPMEERDQTSMTMAIDSNLLPEAKRRIKTFRRELTEFLQKNGKRDNVYHLSISLYPVTRLKDGSRKKLKARRKKR